MASKKRYDRFPIKNLADMRASELKTMCDTRDIDMTGSKDVLIARLRKHAHIDIDWQEPDITIHELRIELRVRGFSSLPTKAKMIAQLEEFEEGNKPRKRIAEAKEESSSDEDEDEDEDDPRNDDSTSDWSGLDKSDSEGLQLRKTTMHRLKMRKGDDPLGNNFFKFYKLMKKTRFILDYAAARADETRLKQEDLAESDTDTSRRRSKRNKRSHRHRRGSYDHEYDLRDSVHGMSDDEIKRRRLKIDTMEPRDRNRLKKVKRKLKKKGEMVRPFSTQQLRQGNEHILGIARVLGHTSDALFNARSDEDEESCGREVYCIYRTEFEGIPRDEITPERALLGVFNKKSVASQYCRKSTKEKWRIADKVLNYDDFFSEDEMSDRRRSDRRDDDGDVEMSSR